MRRAPFLALATMVSACSRSSPAPTPVDGSLSSDPAFPATSTMEAVACDNRSPCGLEGGLQAGTAADGAHLFLVSVNLGPNPDHPSCAARERWLIRSTPSVAGRVQLIARDCASASMATPTLTVTSPGHVRYAASEAGREPRATDVDWGLRAVTVDLSLDPPSVERWQTREWGDNGEGQDSYWDWRSFQGEKCLVDGDGPCTSSWISIPRVAVDDPTFLESGWRSTELADCAMRLDGSASHGFVDPPGPTTATVRALVTGSTLLVEVTDDKWVTTGAAVDNLVVVRGSDFSDPVPLRPTRRIIVNANTQRWRFDITGDEIAIRYDDTDDGRTVQKLASSSFPVHPDMFVRIDADEAVCHVDQGRLRVERTAVADRNIPLVVGQ